MDSTLVIVLIAAAFALVAWAVAQAVTVYFRGEKRKLHQRLSSETAAARLSSVERSSILLSNEPKGLSAALARKAMLATINRHLMLAWPELQLSKFLGMVGILGAGALGLAFLITQSWIIASAAGAAGAYAPFFVLSSKRNSRQRLLTVQLPEALDFLSRVLRAGHSLTTGLQMASEELPEPLSGEFRRAYDQHSLGQSLDDSLKEMANRIESTDFAFFVSAVLIQRQTGGDLSEVLNNISHMIRQRIRLQAHVRAKTAEGRFTGYILVCFPVGMFALIYVLNPGYADKLLHTVTGQKLIGLSFGLQMTGLFFIRKLTIVKVQLEDRVMDNQMLFMVLIAGAVALVGYFICMVFVNRAAGKHMRNRLSGEGGNTPSIMQKQPSALNMEKARGVFHKIGQAAAQPFMPESREGQSAMRKRLAYAGVYASNAPTMLKGSMVILTVLFCGIGYPIGTYLGMPMLGMSVGALIGYLGPTMWLRFATKKHQRSLEHALPDALDLMVVCVEAGLAIDAAMQRVGEELVLAHPRLSRELSIVHMETRVGLSRADALKNLGARTNSACLQGLASLLIQADRFGTSIAGALRTHGEGLRMARQFKAEELAAQASVKMTFPLVLFIFPATFIVLMGPCVIQMMESPLFK